MFSGSLVSTTTSTSSGVGVSVGVDVDSGAGVFSEVATSATTGCSGIGSTGWGYREAHAASSSARIKKTGNDL